MKNKKGQFYLVAAIIIILAVSGIASVRNYAVVKSEPRKIQDISAELKEESIRIVDYGIYSKENMTKLLNNFTSSEFGPYFLKKTENTSIVFIYGNATDLYSAQYSPESTGRVYATFGGTSSQWSTFIDYTNITKINPAGASEINISVLGKEFVFNVKQNEMFYFLITQEKEGEIYIERN